MLAISVIGGIAQGTETVAPEPPDELKKAVEALKSDPICKQEVLYSQDKEEVLIRHFFQDAGNGFFLDVGSSDYKKLSTTYYLEKHLHWKGIAIDALKQYENDYVKYRPGTKFLSFAVSDKKGGTVDFYTERGAEVFSSTIKEATYRIPKPVAIKVPVITLDALLKKEGINRIDFLSMDIEAGEVKALNGFNIGKYRPLLVCIEVQPEMGVYFAKEIMEYFVSHGYERIDAYTMFERKANWYFKPKGYQFSPKDLHPSQRLLVTPAQNRTTESK